MPNWYSHPHLILAIFFVLVGFYVLIKGADFLVRGAVTIASRYQLSPVVIGATVVAFGTSLPELAVSVGSNMKALAEGGGYNPDGPAAIAIGNIVGSNIFNIGAILGLSAIVKTLPFPSEIKKRDLPIMFGALVMLVIFSVWGAPYQISRWEAGFLFAGLIAFTVFAIQSGKVDTEDVPEVDSHESMLKTIGFIGLGISMLMIGGDVSLNGAISLSHWFGLSERVIGLTVMSIGTSLPELATSIQAVRRGHSEMAVANVVGSNIFNVLCIVGVAGLIIPLPVPQAMVQWDFFWMMGFGLALLWPVVTGKDMGRIYGSVLVTCLVSYIVLLLLYPQLGS